MKIIIYKISLQRVNISILVILHPTVMDILEIYGYLWDSYYDYKLSCTWIFSQLVIESIFLIYRNRRKKKRLREEGERCETRSDGTGTVPLSLPTIEGTGLHPRPLHQEEFLALPLHCQALGRGDPRFLLLLHLRPDLLGLSLPQEVHLQKGLIPIN